jgi:hypothetical protein
MTQFDKYGCDYDSINPGGRITANPKTLMRQAKYTAAEYLNAAVIEIDEKFGDGYAKKNPELIAAYMNTAALDYGSAIIARSIQDLKPEEQSEQDYVLEQMGLPPTRFNKPTR